MYNVAAFRVDNVRIADAFGIAMSEEAMQANMEASSAVNYDFAIGTESFSMLLPLRRAQLLVVGRRFRDAELLLDEIDVAALEEKSIPLLVVDRAWTKVELGKIDEGRELSKDAAKHLESMTHIDEIAYVNARLGTIAGLRGARLQKARGGGCLGVCVGSNFFGGFYFRGGGKTKSFGVRGGGAGAF
ncbi:MAG: hypothetical protein IPP87_11535 [Ideonella sp.]|nr:hypothetical protein [Ideonella sp.]